MKLTQNSYPEFRLEETEIPFSRIFVDYAGPYYVYQNKVKTKVWLLILSCLYTRAINLKVCVDMTANEFVKSLQLHSFEFGVPNLVMSDSGSNLIAGSKTIESFLDDHSTAKYFRENNTKVLSFQQYYKGCPKLGSLVESCVKLTKRLISGSVGKNVLDFREFEFFISQTRHIVNRRPIAYKEALRDCSPNEIPDTISPEMLIYGRRLLSINLVPGIQSSPIDELDPSDDYNPVDRVVESYKKLKKVRQNLLELYHSQFIPNLITQATNEKDRYVKVPHDRLEVGDIVLIKEEHSKPSDYPMARVVDLKLNNIGEVTGATLLKGN